MRRGDPANKPPNTAAKRPASAREPTQLARPRPSAGSDSPAARAKARQKAQPRDRPSGKTKDQARTLALLWGAHERSSRSGLTVHTIVGAGVELADREGFDAVSMRRLAELLEVGTMSLYTHVPGKAELTDLMIDAVYGGLYEDVAEPQRAPGGYRAGLRLVAERNKALYARHHWLLDVPLERPVLGPHACTKHEAELRVLDGIGLTDLEIDSVQTLLMMHVQGTSRASLTEQRAQQASGMTEMEWWAATIPMLERVMTGQFPVAARVGKAAGLAIQPDTSAEHMYRFGLDVICGTVAALIAKQKP